MVEGRWRLGGTGTSTEPLAQPPAQRRFLALLRAQPWVVYAKHTLAGPEQALDYLARYTYKTAISNERLRALDEHNVSFTWRDRVHGNRRKLMPLPAQQFLERFALHVLPAGFTRIRHYGLLANRNKAALLAQAAAALHARLPLAMNPSRLQPSVCACCTSIPRCVQPASSEPCA